MSLKIAELEQQLREIWKGFSKNEQLEQAITRARVMNLIVYTASKDADAEISQVLADVSYESPGRMIVLFRDAGLPASVMNGWVNALCHKASGGRKQVCCEQIMIHAGERDASQWSSVVLPLLVPDLPVFLWWHDRPDSDLDLLNAVLEACDRLIIDSALLQNLSTITDLMKNHGDWLAISDLNWSRLTPWRSAIAGFYEHSLCRPCFEELTQIEVECGSPFQESRKALLLVGWLASSLNLKWAEKPHLLNSRQERIAVNLHCGRSDSDQLQSVRLISRNSEFLVSAMPDVSYLQSQITIQKQNQGTQLIKLPEQDLSAFLNKEVTILGHDRIYERAIQFLV
ncbi:glucose-6-phosphate dehydrogenase assembly protein OpcA [bacterium]|nr:glucose-6-phosphate dehydrogenase assembly protein OpcA [bacterium]